MQEDPISWDLRPSNLPVFVGNRAPPASAGGETGEKSARARNDDDRASEKKVAFAGGSSSSGNGHSAHAHMTGPRPGAGHDDGNHPAITGGELADVSDYFHVSVVDTMSGTDVSLPLGPGRDAIRDDDFAGADDELMFDDTQSARDPGLRPTPVRLACDGGNCQSESYVVELGSCGGVLGLVADLVPFWSPGQGRVVSVPRLVESSLRRARFESYLGRGGQIEDAVSLSTFLAAADLAEPAHHPETAEPLKTSRAIDRLAVAARRIGDDDAQAPTKVKCPHCKEGHLILRRA